MGTVVCSSTFNHLCEFAWQFFHVYKKSYKLSKSADLCILTLHFWNYDCFNPRPVPNRSYFCCAVKFLFVLSLLESLRHLLSLLYNRKKFCGRIMLWFRCCSRCRRPSVGTWLLFEWTDFHKVLTQWSLLRYKAWDWK